MRFQIGEIAIFAVTRCICGYCQSFIGKECEIVALNPRVGEIVRGQPVLVDGDYVIHFAECSGVALDFQLRKKTPPAEPAALTRDQAIEEHA